MVSPVVDVHGHLMPDEVFDHVPAPIEVATRNDDKALVVDGVRGRFTPATLRDAKGRSREQAAHGVDISIVGPWIDQVKAAQSTPLQVQWCRTLSDALRAAAEADPALRFLAALPDLDGGAAAEELERAVAGGAVGGLLAALPQRDGLNAPHFDLLWAMAERLDVPIILHPGYFQPPDNMRDYYLANSVGNPFETTLAVGRLIGADVPGRYPDLKLVLCHGGGYFPYQYGRMDAAFTRWPANQGTSRRLPSDLLKWFWYDTVLYTGAPAKYLLDLVGTDRIVAGTDCPFMMADYTAFDAPESLGLNVSEREAVLGGNAMTLFRLTSP